MAGFLLSRTWTKSSSSQVAAMRMLIRGYATEVTATEPSMVLRLRSELKTAMKAKDKTRLDVIRTVLGHFKNEELRGQAFNTDEKIRKYFLRQANAQKTVALQFETQDRKDLSDRELAQAAILEGYAHEVKVASEQDVRDAIDKIVEDTNSKGWTVNMGAIIKGLRAKGGPLQGELFDYDQALNILREKEIPGAVVRKKE